MQSKKEKKTKPLNITTWKVRTLMTGTTQTDFRHRSLLLLNLPGTKIDIAGLSETRLAGKGEMTEKCSGYSFFLEQTGTQ